MCAYPRRAEEAPGASTRASRPRARLTASWSFTSTTLLFGDGRRTDLVRHAAFGGVELPVAPRLSVHYGAGGVLAGSLTRRDAGASSRGAARAELGPGPTAFLGAGGRVLDERRLRPFVQATATLSVTHARLGPDRYTAVDVRAGAVVGKTFADAVTPYAVGRVFGGPIFTRLDGVAVTGTDRYKFQVGGGLSLALPARVDAFVEGIGLGERGVSAGLGASF